MDYSVFDVDHERLAAVVFDADVLALLEVEFHLTSSRWVAVVFLNFS